MATPDETISELRQILTLQDQNRVLEIFVRIQNVGEGMTVALPFQGTFLGLYPPPYEMVIDPNPLLVYEAAEAQGVVFLEVPPFFRRDIV